MASKEQSLKMSRAPRIILVRGLDLGDFNSREHGGSTFGSFPAGAAFTVPIRISRVPVW